MHDIASSAPIVHGTYAAAHGPIVPGGNVTATRPVMPGGNVSAYGSPAPNVTLSLSKGPRDVAAAILFREILKPLAQGLGPVGEIALGAVADDLFVRKLR